MANKTIEVYGVTVELTDKGGLTEIIDGMLEDGSQRLLRAKTNKTKRSEKMNIQFFGSIRHYLRGGE